MIIKIPKSEAEAQTILDLLIASEDSKEILDNRKVLQDILATTEHYGLRYLIARKLAEAGDDMLLPILIKTIMADLDIRHIGGLVYACSFYDCSEYIWLFSDILLLKNDISFLDAFGVIEKMNKLNDEMIGYTCRKLYLHSIEIIKEDHRYGYVLEMIDILESKLSA